MASELIFNDISRDIYLMDSKHENHSALEVGGVEEFGSSKYMILKTSDNTSNGIQAMAVAPIKNGKDTSEIVIAYAGKSFSDLFYMQTFKRLFTEEML